MSQINAQPSAPLTADYYIARPESGQGRPVLVLHAWWGLNDFVKQLCDRLAKEGFIALAPDLYHGAVAATIEQAEQLASNLERDVAAQEITRAARQLESIGGKNEDGIGVIGFSLGGSWALWLADQQPSPVVATVVFYATRPGDYGPSQSAFQFHMAETDEFEPASEVETLRSSLKAAGKPAEFYMYPGTTHWFFESDRPDAYRGEPAQLAWERTVQFLKAHIKGS